MRKSGGGVQELRCTHRVHKEVKTGFMSDTLHVIVNTTWRRQPPLVHFSPSMSDIKSMVHEGSSFLDMHEVEWKHPDCLDLKLISGLLITMSPFGGGGWWRGPGGQSSVGLAVAVKRRLVRWGRSRTRGGSQQMDRSPRRRSSTRPIANFPCGDIADIILWMEDLHPWAQTSGVSPELLQLYDVHVFKSQGLDCAWSCKNCPVGPYWRLYSTWRIYET